MEKKAGSLSLHIFRQPLHGVSSRAPELCLMYPVPGPSLGEQVGEKTPGIFARIGRGAISPPRCFTIFSSSIPSILVGLDIRGGKKKFLCCHFIGLSGGRERFCSICHWGLNQPWLGDVCGSALCCSLPAFTSSKHALTRLDLRFLLLPL